ncbi:retron Ec78 anti-phage system effector ATPase PtuA [Snodgrassella communis]|uniref:retron Ec78 anti-phage system effector ATPase PtuA n=1 Tax=Snodgrassella communis TaxID=2946699 RepID=UPI0015D56173|nr:retron Ec78 anti-phage system effector ATPase PtuA [Snodgrassella communis]
MENIDNTNSLRNLKQNSQAGNIFATFQLYDFYANLPETNFHSKELTVEKNKYFQECIDFLEALIQKDSTQGLSPKNQIVLESLVLKDIKKFYSFDINFHHNLTVIIGENGSGKTTILECIAKILTWIAKNLIKEKANGSPVTYDEIRNKAKDFGEIQAKFMFGGQQCSGSLAKAVKGVAEKKDSSVEELKYLANIWRVINSQHLINLPVFIFYSAKRFILNPKSTTANATKQKNRFDVYSDCLKDRNELVHFKDWFISLNKKGINISSTSTNKELKQKIELFLQQDVQNEDDLLMLLEERRNIKKLNLNTEKSIDEIKEIKILKEAITLCVPEITDIYVDISSGIDEIYVQLDDKKLNINQLSDGQRIFLGLVADLTYRLIILNPKLENPLNGQGIVLVDEIEAHLHPKWQQEILVNLTKTFPNIQFIVTTHSPQVLSTVYKQQIRQLVKSVESKEEDTFITKKPELQTRGVMSSDILERIMGTYSIPEVPEAKSLDEFNKYIQENKYNTPEANLLLEKLKRHFGEKHPEILSCERLIKVRKLLAEKTKKES